MSDQHSSLEMGSKQFPGRARKLAQGLSSNSVMVIVFDTILNVFLNAMETRSNKKTNGATYYASGPEENPTMVTMLFVVHTTTLISNPPNNVRLTS
jgi:hypothetical protein